MKENFLKIFKKTIKYALHQGKMTPSFLERNSKNSPYLIPVLYVYIYVTMQKYKLQINCRLIELLYVFVTTYYSISLY